MANVTGTNAHNSLVGTSGNDLFDGLAGNDTLNGGAGDDTYLFGRGSGTDLIASSYDSRANRTEILSFKAGILPTDIQASFVGSNLVLAIKGTTDSITVQDFKYQGTPSNGYNPIQLVKFTNGTTWNTTQITTAALSGTAAAESLIGTNHNDQLNGFGGNDTLTGGGGDDTYFFGRGDGKDLISSVYDSRATRQEILSFKAGVLPTDIQASFVGSNLVLAIKGTTDSITVQDFKYQGTPSNGYNPIQLVKFTNGTTWNTTQITTAALSGTAAAESLIGTNHNDQLNGFGGNDTLTGGDGDDTYFFGRGDGKDLISSVYDSRATRQEILSFKAGALPTDIQASFVGSNLVLAIKGTTDSITVQDFKYQGTPSNGYNPIQLVKFTNGTTWNTTQITTAALSGTAAAESLIGTNHNDQLNGFGGNDTLTGGGGDDTYFFGRGDGKDLISSAYDSRATREEILSFKAGVLPTDIQTSFVGNNLVLAIKGTTDSITVQDFKYQGTPSNGYNPIQLVKFANGTSWDLAYLKRLTGLSAAAPMAAGGATAAFATSQVDQLISAMAGFAAPSAAVMSTAQDPLAQMRPIAIGVN